MTLTCDEVHERNALLVSGSLPATEVVDVVRHLDSCVRCQQATEDLTSAEHWGIMTDALRAGGDVEANASSDGQGLARIGLDAFVAYLAPTDEPKSLGRIGNMEVLGVIGHGGAGIVYKGHDAALGRNVAIKLLNPAAADNLTARKRFAAEARAMAAIRHENVVPVYAVAEHNALPYFVMEYVAGGTLSQRVEKSGPLSTVETVRVGLQIAQALAAAHRHGVIHRDVKPSNILLDPGVERVRVTDFGLAQARGDQQHTETGLLVGTPQYMSPEQVRGDELDGRSDLFSLGGVLYFCCTGRAPFEGNSIYATMQAVSSGHSLLAEEANSDVPGWLSELIRRLHSLERGDRIDGAEQLVGILEQELAHLQQPQSVGLPLRVWSREKDLVSRSKRPWWMLVAFAVIVLGVCAAFLPMFGTPQEKLSPFTGVRCPDERTAVVTYEGRNYELLSINDHTTAEILAYSSKRYRDLWEKRFAEDLVEVLEGMGDRVDSTVKLRLRNLKTKRMMTVRAAKMTHQNRQIVYAKRWEQGKARTNLGVGRRGFAKLSPFTEVTHPSRTTATVTYEGKQYELVAMAGKKTEAILKHCRTKYSVRWDMRFAEDLVEVLAGLGLKPGKTISLELRDPETGKIHKIQNAAMTPENRSAVYRKRNRGVSPLVPSRKPALLSRSARGFATLSPFTAVTHPTESSAVVTYEGRQYELVSMAGRKTEDLLADCRKHFKNDWDRRFAEDLVEVLDKMGMTIGDTISLELRDPVTKKLRKVRNAAMTAKNRQAVYEARNRDREGGDVVRYFDEAADPSAQQAALTRFHTALKNRWSYYRAGGDIDAAIDVLRKRINRSPGLSSDGFAMHLNGIISQGIDGHAGVGVRLAPGRIPFLIEPVGDRYIAFLPDRSRFVLEDYPYITAIDGVDIGDWCKQVSVQKPKGSPQYIKRHALRMLRSLNHWRAVRGIKPSDEVRMVLANEAGESVIATEKIDSRSPIYGTWPRTETRTLKSNIGYLRITDMNRDAAERVREWMPKWRETDGLIVDVRDNGGGTREALLTLAGYLLGEQDQPRVVNTAKYRLFEEFDTDHLEARYMYRANSDRWTDRERAAITAFAKSFKPAWSPPVDEFSEWHYLVLSRGHQAFHYSKPVVVLTNAKCFSATDIFVAGMKELPNVTIMGTATGGGSARTTSVSIAAGISARIGSMVSYQTSGKLFDGVGVEPDVKIEPTPGYFVGQSDSTLDAAVKLIRGE